MDEDIKFFVGLDVHKETISISVCEGGREASRFVGTIRHDVAGLLKVLRKLGASAGQLVAYEAGPTGYGLQRRLAQEGYSCQVIAPSLIPQRAETCLESPSSIVGSLRPSATARGPCQ